MSEGAAAETNGRRQESDTEAPGAAPDADRGQEPVTGPEDAAADADGAQEPAAGQQPGAANGSPKDPPPPNPPADAAGGVEESKADAPTQSAAPLRQDVKLNFGTHKAIPGTGIRRFFSFLFMTWITPVIAAARKRTVDVTDFGELPDGFATDYNLRRFRAAFKARMDANKPSLAGALWDCFKWRFIRAVTLLSISESTNLILPVLVRALVNFLVDSDSPNDRPDLSEGLWLCFAFVCVMAFGAMARVHANLQASLVGVGARSVLLSAVFENSLNLPPSAIAEMSTGSLVTLVTTDIQKFREFFFPIQQLFVGPVTILASFIILIFLVGPPIIAGFVIMICFIPLTAVFGRKLQMASVNKLRASDARTRVSTEIIQGMRVVKSYGWEQPYREKIEAKRATEAAHLLRSSYLTAIILPISLALPALAITVTFVLRALAEDGLPEAGDAFAALSYMLTLTIPTTLIPMGLANLVQALTSLHRVDRFMNLAQLSSKPRLPPATGEERAITMGPSHFAWCPKEQPVLRDISVEVPAGAMWAVVGQVGSGKSSLLSSMLSELESVPVDGGESVPVTIRGSVAFVAQTAFIKNATLRDNVLLGLPFDEDRYQVALHAASLLPDLEVLPGGDQVEIGENGVNLSGGQKQRVSLARAVYANADVYLFDDPLSAVDAHVGSHIFTHTFSKVLEESTRVLVTNQVQYLSSRHVDHILVMSNGTIAERGTYRDLMERGGQFSSLVDAQRGSQPADAAPVDPASIDAVLDVVVGGGDKPAPPSRLSAPSDAVVVKSKSPKAPMLKDLKNEDSAGAKFTKSGRLVKDETTVIGHIPMRAYTTYFGHMASTGVLALMFFFFMAANPFQTWAGSVFGTFATEPDELTTSEFVYLYIIGNFGFLLFTVARSLMWARVSINTANYLHNNLVATLVRCPMHFFESTPTGRILNRLGRDQNEVDMRLPFLYQFLINMGFSILTTLGLIAWTSPWFLIAMPFLVALYWWVRTLYQHAAYQLQRIESVSLSPVFSLYTETLSGLETIRAFDRREHFSGTFEDHVTIANRAVFYLMAALAWLRVRTQLVSATLIALTTFLVVITRDEVDVALAGLALTNTTNILPTLQFFVQFSADVASKMNSVERLIEFAELDTEPPARLPNDEQLVKSWPSKGRVEFQDVDMRYRKDLPLVLKHVSFVVEAGVRVGICGRTGSGKSSLFAALLRLVQPTAGRILIDDVECNNVGLTTLRTSISLIPQDPVLFSGTIRENLDPHGQHSDADVWRALERCHMAGVVRAGRSAREVVPDTPLPAATKPAPEASKPVPPAVADDAVASPSGLGMTVSEQGSNFSLGERQLICLGRALLRQTRVLLLDECSSSIDPETDALLQDTLRTQFPNCTVLTIAHRLNTIMDSDMILVMEDGDVAEYDSPAQLLTRPESLFFKLAKESEEQSARLARRSSGDSKASPVARPPQ